MRRRIFAALFVIFIAALYLTGLTRMGMYSTDEPRYADIGRAMARTGDWITPRLWGLPWFEKPPLLYWMTAAGFRLGLSVDLAPRLPLAVLSVVFLIAFRHRLAQVFDGTNANAATAILATTAGWIAYSHVAVTDMPLAAFFTMAVLFALRPANGSEPSRLAAAICLGLAVLAKSGPPIVLFLPILIADWRNWKKWILSWPIVVFLVVAVPWHLAAATRNGSHFLYVLFVEQQLGRFFNNSRQHEQPWWFYGPYFLVLLFPWFPLLFRIRKVRDDERTFRLAIVVAVGLIFFSASVNKLPGYVLPLIPSACILIGVSVARSPRRDFWLVAPMALLGGITIPEVAARGLEPPPIPILLVSVAGSGLVGAAIVARLRSRAFPVAIILCAACFLALEYRLLPLLDSAASGRPVWISGHPVCSPVLPRGKLYGLYYYSEKVLPDCGIVDKNPAQFGGDEPTK